MLPAAGLAPDAASNASARLVLPLPACPTSASVRIRLMECATGAPPGREVSVYAPGFSIAILENRAAEKISRRNNKARRSGPGLEGESLQQVQGVSAGLSGCGGGGVPCLVGPELGPPPPFFPTATPPAAATPP